MKIDSTRTLLFLLSPPSLFLATVAQPNNVSGCRSLGFEKPISAPESRASFVFRCSHKFCMRACGGALLRRHGASADAVLRQERAALAAVRQRRSGSCAARGEGWEGISSEAIAAPRGELTMCNLYGTPSLVWYSKQQALMH